ncbi:MAG: c-type cytochrome [Rhodoferax sp.]|nr:c-type cytochrome [Rhodoferax sp.]
MLALLLPAAAQAQSVVRGQMLFESRCVACHSVDLNRVGPALQGVVGRQAGKAPGYTYSTAMTAATHTWDRATVKAWLSNPEDVVPGQAMNYRLDLPQDRDDMVAYLASLSSQASAAPAVPPSSH